MSVSGIPFEVVPAYKSTQYQVRSKDRAVVPAGRSRNGEQVNVRRAGRRPSYGPGRHQFLEAHANA